MGLLDQFSNLNPEQTQGLLAAASQMLQQSSDPRRPANIMQTATSGAMAYHGGMEEARRRKREEEQASQLEKMRALQMQGLQGDFDHKQQGRQRDSRIQEALLNDPVLGRLRMPPGAGPQGIHADSGMPAPAPVPSFGSTLPGGPLSPRVGGPDWMQSFERQQANQAPSQQPELGQPGPASGPQANRASTMQQALEQMTREAQIRSQNGDLDGANKLYEHAVKFMPEVHRIEVGTDGSQKPINIITMKDGSQRISDFGVKPDIHFADDGANTAIPVNGYTGQKIGPGMRKLPTPGELLSADSQRRRLSFDRSQVEGTGPAASEAMIDAIGTGKMAPPSGYALRNPKMLQMMERVAQKFPDFDATEYDGKKRAMRDFTTGRQGDSIRSFAVASDHLKQLDGLVDALNNKDVPLVNKYSNIIAQQTGSVAPTNFEAAKGIVAKEVLKSIVAGGGGVEERQELAHLLSTAKTGPQLKGVIGTYLHLMEAQKQGLERQYELSTGRKDASTRFNYGSPGAAPSAAPQTPAGPLKKSAIKGQILQGYRFKGGNAADQNNWEKL